ncbi:hypothetical protein RUND412_000875 [Rhizina undulata]
MTNWDLRASVLGLPADGRSSEPLLDGREESRGRDSIAYEGTREVAERARIRQEMRSRSPATASTKETARRKYLLAGVCLILSLFTFVVQTETAVYIQHHLSWRKPYAMLYLTHGSWSMLFPAQLLILKLRKPNTPWSSFIRSHLSHLRTTAQMVVTGSSRLSHSQVQLDPRGYMIRSVAFISSALTIAGSSWYIAVNMTSPSDLTAIYNCSAFFAYAFSIPLLNEKPRVDKIFSVAVAIIGVLIVAYGDGGGNTTEIESARRISGNIIIGIGSVLYGFYEVLYKKLACPPENTSPGRSVIFANAVASGIGAFTLLVLWIPLPVLHFWGLEEFELPTKEVAWMLVISVISNAVFSGSFLVLISLTSPVLSSVAALLTIFLVALTDYFLNGTPLSFAAVVGGMLIVGAFFLLAWSTWKELTEERKKEADLDDDLED